MNISKLVFGVSVCFFTIILMSSKSVYGETAEENIAKIEESKLQTNQEIQNQGMILYILDEEILMQKNKLDEIKKKEEKFENSIKKIVESTGKSNNELIKNKLFERLGSWGNPASVEKNLIENERQTIEDTLASLEGNFVKQKETLRELQQKLQQLEADKLVLEEQKNAEDVKNQKFIPPVTAPISSAFGYRVGYDATNFHKGIDYGAAIGTPIQASQKGTVVLVQNDGAPVSGYGICTIIEHENGLWTLYAHQSEAAVQVGQTVEKGQIIGTVGNTGQSFGSHLHFEIRTSFLGGEDQVLNPSDYVS